MVCEILWQFINTLTADDKYSLRNRENLTLPIQMQLFEKQKIFSLFFAAFLKSSLNFENFEMKDEPLSWCISKIRDRKTDG